MYRQDKDMEKSTRRPGLISKKDRKCLGCFHLAEQTKTDMVL
jgi:hypothetical protein